MNGESVKEIRDLALKATEIVNVQGVNYSVNEMHPVFYDPIPAAVNIATLEGLVAFAKLNIDNYDLKTTFLHIYGPDRVSWETQVNGLSARRTSIVNAVHDVRGFNYGSFMPLEEFMIQVNSKFVQTEQLSRLIKYVSKIDINSLVKVEDDGVSQNVNIKKGLSGANTQRIPAPSRIKLRAIRTFAEVEQPESEMLFRMKRQGDDIYCALFNASGAFWELDAIRNIHTYLIGQTDLPVIG